MASPNQRFTPEGKNIASWAKASGTEVIKADIKSQSDSVLSKIANAKVSVTDMVCTWELSVRETEELAKCGFRDLYVEDSSGIFHLLEDWFLISEFDF